MTKTKTKIGGVCISTKNTRRRVIKNAAVSPSKKTLATASAVAQRKFLRACKWDWDSTLEGELIHTDKTGIEPVESIVGTVSKGSLFLEVEACDGKTWVQVYKGNKREAVAWVRAIVVRLL